MVLHELVERLSPDSRLQPAARPLQALMDSTIVALDADSVARRSFSMCQQSSHQEVRQIESWILHVTL